jgi:hypothetical protein
MDERKQQKPAQQQQQGGQQQQQQGGTDNVHGEGNYKATRDYNQGIAEHMKNHDVEREAREAAPKSEQEQREMDEAERKGRERAKGDGRQQ